MEATLFRWTMAPAELLHKFTTVTSIVVLRVPLFMVTMVLKVLLASLVTVAMVLK